MLSIELSLQKSQILSEKRYLFWNFAIPESWILIKLIFTRNLKSELAGALINAD